MAATARREGDAAAGLRALRSDVRDLAAEALGKLEAASYPGIQSMEFEEPRSRSLGVQTSGAGGLCHWELSRSVQGFHHPRRGLVAGPADEPGKAQLIMMASN